VNRELPGNFFFPCTESRHNRYAVCIPPGSEVTAHRAKMGRPPARSPAHGRKFQERMFPPEFSLSAVSVQERHRLEEGPDARGAGTLQLFPAPFLYIPPGTVILNRAPLPTTPFSRIVIPGIARIPRTIKRPGPAFFPTPRPHPSQMPLSPPLPSLGRWRIGYSFRSRVRNVIPSIPGNG